MTTMAEGDRIGTYILYIEKLISETRRGH
jgi:hypothetical protein